LGDQLVGGGARSGRSAHAPFAQTLVLGFEDYEQPGRQLADALSLPFALVEVHRFPDGEAKIRLPGQLPPALIFVRSLDDPNDKLVELMLAAHTAREQGAEHLTLVAPYLCYMRQDIAFQAGESVSQRIVGTFLAGLFDSVLTVDPHLHRTSKLSDAVPARATLAESASELLGQFVRSQPGRPILIGPDAESLQWVQAAAASASCEYLIGEKHRAGDYEVGVHLPDADLHGRHVILVDDVASTGQTLASAAVAARRAGAVRVDALVTHALFAAGAIDTIKNAGIESLWSTDSIVHCSNCIALAPLLATSLAQLQEGNR
jgi:ribose-phosphate pyrophosphokinase